MEEKKEEIGIMGTINGMIATLEHAGLEAGKFLDGNNAAGTRARKDLMNVKVAAHQVRLWISETKAGRDEH